MYRIESMTESAGENTKDIISDKAHREKGISELAFRNQKLFKKSFFVFWFLQKS